ncbi:MFS general substrate transporter [Aspergillus sclerotioniger CBS 115572]|uniref:MFS general substrate transporter n=1 Tax=Aspergillus sclerotioniger CBS 115572 TaxID=1450535 RepID=A0A317W2F4_9EURO|nr:MFS general substrate transporter [Aspergillus sclerotioniger CBS 115572]PWY80816.1 MFS general substrate transporter [Aspergillus sclerotioniger CBS 115572]
MTNPEIESGANPPLKRIWYRTSLFNACVIGAVGFLAPGLWNAMNSLGAGGEEKPFLVNAANALVFGLMGFFCIFGAPIANRIGLKWTLLLGAAGYPVYAAGLYTNDRFGNVWLVLVGAVACGISAGLFWASEGAIAIGYPEPSKRARYLNIWVWWRTLGPIIGNSIVLALNIKNKGAGSVGYNTYIVFIVLQCLAVPVALLLTPPDKVQRADGSRVIIRVEPTWTAEFKALWKTCKNRTVILLLPVFWAVYFNEYSGNFETYYFGVRARSLIAFLSDWVTILASQIISHWLDCKKIPAKTRLTYGWYYVILVHVIAWILAWVVQEQYTSSSDPPMMDYTTPGFVKGAFVLFMWSFAQQTAQNWLYYLVGSMTENIAELTRLTGILRGQESFGEAVSYGLNTKEWFGGRVPMAVNTILLGLCVIPTWIVVSNHEMESAADGESEQRDVVDEKGIPSLEVKETGGFAVGDE